MQLDKNYQLVFEENPSSSTETILLEGISEAAYKKGMSKTRTFAFIVKDQNNRIVAGLKGYTYYKCLEIDLLWVEEDFRGKGIGSILIGEAEKIGRDRHCYFATLNTMEWEALGFYQKMGYDVEFVREGYEKNSKMCFLKKMLK